MTRAVGPRLGSNEIVGQLGEGVMGAPVEYGNPFVPSF